MNYISLLPIISISIQEPLIRPVFACLRVGKNYVLLLKSVLACRVPQLEPVEDIQVVLPRVLVYHQLPWGEMRILDIRFAFEKELHGYNQQLLI